jgi:hypothetical protein
MKLPDGIKNVKDLAYLTRRKLENETGEQRGTVVMWRTKGEEEFNYTLRCGISSSIIKWYASRIFSSNSARDSPWLNTP